MSKSKISKKMVMNKNTRTRKNNNPVKSKSNSKLLENFEKEITVKFFEMLLLIKLFHWKTYSYATHKATDDLYSKFNENMDHFIEVLLGKTGLRIDLINKKTIALYDLNNKTQLINKINSFKNYLVGLNNNKAMKLMSNADLLTIRDEILADTNQFLYLLSLN